MAAGKLHFKSDAGGITTVSREAGATNGELVLPVSGTVASVGGAVTDNAIARYDSTTGKLQNSGVIVDDSGNVGIGVTQSFSPTSYKVLTIGAAGNGLYGYSSSFGTLVSSNAKLDTSTWKYHYTGYGAALYDIGASAPGQHIWKIAPSGTAGNPITWTNAMTLDASGNVLLTSGTGGLGYGTGAGGTVTQLTSKTTAVTLNKPTGVITMNNAALAAGATVSFKLDNVLLAANDIVATTVIDDFGGAAYKAVARHTYGSYCLIDITNTTASSRSDAVRIAFVIIKGATA